MSSGTSVNTVLAEYLAGKASADRVALVVMVEHYQATRKGERGALRPIVDVIERAHPGVVELKASEGRPGFDVRLADRSFPKRYEAELREAVTAVLANVATEPLPAAAKPGLLQRIVTAVRRLFNA
jgi:hypothetical protein